MLRITTQLIVDELNRRHINYEILDRSLSFIQIETKHGPRFLRSSMVDSASPNGVFTADNKFLSYQIIKSLGVAQPDTVESSEKTTNNHFLDKHGQVVVKPIAASHGHGVTVGVNKSVMLEKAVELAQSHCKYDKALIQQQISGSDVRVLIIGHEFAAAASREPASVIGDGKSTVTELIERENTNPLRKGVYNHTSQLAAINLSAVKNHLKKDIYRIAKKGEIVQVVGTSNISGGGKSRDITEILPEKIKSQAVSISKAMKLPVCGVDFMVKDIRDEKTYYCLEVNACPGFGIHDVPSSGKPQHVAAKLIDYIMEQE